MTDIESYKYVVEIFKGYLDTAITANVWFYTVTGAIAAYYLTHHEEKGKRFLRYSLLVPFFFGLLLSITSVVGIFKAGELNNKVIEIAGQVGVSGAPPIEILVIFLWASAFLSALTCAALVSLFTWWPKFLYRDAPDETPGTEGGRVELAPADKKALPPASPQDTFTPADATATKKNGVKRS